MSRRTKQIAAVAAASSISALVLVAVLAAGTGEGHTAPRQQAVGQRAQAVAQRATAEREAGVAARAGTALAHADRTPGRTVAGNTVAAPERAAEVVVKVPREIVVTLPRCSIDRSPRIDRQPNAGISNLPSVTYDPQQGTVTATLPRDAWFDPGEIDGGTPPRCTQPGAHVG